MRSVISFCLLFFVVDVALSQQVVPDTTVLGSAKPDSIIVVLPDSVVVPDTALNVSVVKPDSLNFVAPDSLKADPNELLLKPSTLPDTINHVIESKPVDVPTVSKFKNSKFDVLTLLQGEEMEVEVRQVTPKYIIYSDPGLMETMKIDRREVYSVKYRSGKIDIISSKPLKIPDYNNWREIVVTSDPAGVEGLIELGDVSVSVEASSRTHIKMPRTLEASAIVIAKKKAALLKGEIILITRKEHYRGYGVQPSVTVEGKAFRQP